MHRQRAIRNDGLSQLRNAIANNLSRYSEEDSWAADFFADSDSWEFTSPLELSRRLVLLHPLEDDLHDLENAIRIHKAFPNLSPVQARDPRLWTHLTHVDLWAYMIKRWPVARHLDDARRAERFILSRYFVSRSESRALLRNGAARLWWSAKLTYDSDRTNPYELTAVLLSRLDIAQQLLERNFGRIGTLTKTFLEFLMSNPKDCLEPGGRSRTVVRHLAQSLNLHGGVCLLDTQKPDDLSSFLEQERVRVVASLDDESQE